MDGRLCAAAFVQSRQAYTGCTDAPNPQGVSGRPWCYVESQVATDRLSLQWAAGGRGCGAAQLACTSMGRVPAVPHARPPPPSPGGGSFWRPFRSLDAW